MPLYTIEFKRSALREFRKLPRQARDRIAPAIDALAENPRPAGVDKLQGRDDWRIRVGDYRVIYRIEDQALLIVVVRVGHRSDVYR